MKKIITIAFAAILAGFAISCQKEESVSEKTEAVQYTFNITVNDQVGFDSDASTKGGLLPVPSYKTTWLNGDKIFLFFKPTGGVLLDDRYATLTYNGSSWDGKVSEGQSNLGEDGTLSAVYVYNLSDSVTPVFSDGKWTIATGNTFYNCQTEVSYTVSGSNKISASLVLEAPANFVRFSVFYASGALTCDKVKGWKDIAIGSDLAVSNVTCTGYMDGVANIGAPNEIMDYYGRIVSGNSLNGKTCNFSVVKNGKVYEHAATPSTDTRSFTMTSWTEASGKLPGLFTVGKGADGKAGTADDVQVRFSQGNLYCHRTSSTSSYWTWHFYDEQYKFLAADMEKSGSTDSPQRGVQGSETEIHLFTWGYDNISTNNSYSLNPVNTAGITGHDTEGNEQLNPSTDGDDWGVAYCNSNNITVGTWRTLTTAEWQYLFNNHVKVWGQCNSVNGYFIAPDGFAGDAYDLSSLVSDWTAAEAAGIVFLPAAGNRCLGSYVYGVGDTGNYWSSTANGEYYAYDVSFNRFDVYPGYNDGRSGGYSVRLITESK